MAQQLAENLYHLDIPLVGSPLKNLNSYLILGQRSLLIDTGFRQPSCLEALEAELDSLGVDRNTLDIFATHFHSDHLGLAPQIIRPGATIFLSAVDLSFVNQYSNQKGWAIRAELDGKEGFSPTEIATLWTKNPAKSAAPLPYDDYVPVRDGDQLHYGGYDLTCVSTPGHTPGHMCLFEANHGIFFSGDHILFHITPNICRWPGVEDSLGNYLHSLAKVSLLDVKHVYTAHRYDTGDFQERIAQLQQHHHARLADTLQAVTSHPNQTSYTLAGKLRWSIRAKNWEDFPLVQKFFAVGETESHLDYLKHRGYVKRHFDGTHYLWELA